MSVTSFKEARHHVGHKIVCVIYGTQNVAIECETCCEVLVDWEKDIKKKGEEYKDDKDKPR